MIVKTEAIVLKTMKYRDTSKIVTLFTKNYGKLSAVAKGARDRNLRFGSALDSLSHVQVVLYKKEGADLHLLPNAICCGISGGSHRI
jgi:DNA repair protein RecO (recombination protein O)